MHKQMLKKLIKNTIRRLIKNRSNSKMNTIKQRASKAHKQLCDFTKKAVTRVSDWVTKTRAAHREQVTTNTAYVTALGAAACALVELLTQDRAALAVVAALVAVYVAAHHANTHDHWRPSSSRWDDDGIGWR